MIIVRRGLFKSSYFTPPVGSASPGVNSYFTTFPAVENPISEGGAWIHLGTSWAVVKTLSSPSRTCGTQAGSGAFDDSYAHLSGFMPDVTAQAILYNNSVPGGTTHEYELHFRWADTSSTARGYEVNYAFDGAYTEIVRWNGGLGAFDVLSHVTSPSTGAVATGDILKATIKGNIVTVWKNGQQCNTVDITAGIGGATVWTNGNPGIGLWLGGTPDTQNLYGHTSYSVTEIPNWNWVQANSSSTSGTASSSTVAATFTSAISSGGIVVGIVSWDNSGVGTPALTGVADNQGNTYNVSTTVLDGVNTEAVAIFWRGNITNAPTVVTATFSTATASGRSIIAEEISGGQAATDPSDGNIGQLQTAAGTGTDAVTSGNISTTVDGDLIWGASCDTDGANQPVFGTRFFFGTLIASGTNFAALYSENKVQTSHGSVAATFTQGTGNRRITYVVAFKPL